METKKFRPAIEPVMDFPWAIAVSPDVWLPLHDIQTEVTEIVSNKNECKISEPTDHDEVENIPKKEDVKVCITIDLTSAEYEDENDQSLLQSGETYKKIDGVTDRESRDKTIAITESSQNITEIIEMKPSEKIIKTSKVKSSQKIAEVFEMKYSKTTIETTEVNTSEMAKIFDANFSKEALESKSVRKTMEIQKESLSENTAKVPEGKLSKTNEGTTLLHQRNPVKKYKKNSTDMESSFSMTEDRDFYINSSENMLETIEDMFRKYISEEYLEFLDRSLPVDTCCEEQLSISVIADESETPQSDLSLSRKIQREHDSNTNQKALKTEPKIDLTNDIDSSGNDSGICLESSVQTLSVTTKEAKALPHDVLSENSVGQPKRYSLRQRRKRRVYKDTDEWIEELNFSDEEVCDKIPTNKLKKHKRNTVQYLQKSEDKYMKEENEDRNLQNVVQKRYLVKDKAEEPMHRYIPRKRKSVQTFNCMGCQGNFKSEIQLQLHKALKGCDDVYQCVVCGDFFSSIESLCLHGDTHDVSFCSICGRCFKTKSGLLRHQYDHIGYKPFSCNKCSNSYKTRNELIIHDMYHTGNMPFHCHKCSKGFPTIGQLKRHLSTHTTDTEKELETDPKSVECHKRKACGNIFNSQALLQSHEQADSDIPMAFNEVNISQNDDANIVNIELTHDEVNTNLQTRTAFVQQLEESAQNLQYQTADLVKSEEHRNGSQSKISHEHQSEECEDKFQLQEQVCSVQQSKKNREMSGLHKLKECEGTFQLQVSDEHQLMKQRKQPDIQQLEEHDDIFQINVIDDHQSKKWEKKSSVHQLEEYKVEQQLKKREKFSSGYHLGGNFEVVQQSKKQENMPSGHQLEEYEVEQQSLKQGLMSDVNQPNVHKDSFQLQVSDKHHSKKLRDNFPSELLGVNQMKNHKEDGSCKKSCFTCTQCYEVFKSHMAYLYHKLIHNRDAMKKSHKCDKCPMIFHLETSLMSHQLIHREQRMTVCDTCGETFNNQLDLVYHRATHNSEKPLLKCSKCFKVFQTKGQLDRHFETHSADRQLFPCETCGRTFKTRSGLVRHRMDHTGERRFSCSECTKKFKTNSQLHCHIAKHTGIRPYSCKICGKSFPIKSYLTAHSLKHK